MKTKNLLTISVSLLLSASILSGCGSEKSNGNTTNKTVVLKLAENQPEDYPTTIGDKEFARLVEEKTNGRYKVEVYSGGQLGDEKSAIEQVQLGTIDLARVNASPLAEFSDEIGVLSMPYLFSSEKQKWDVLNGEVGKKLLDTLQSDGIVGLTYYDSGSRSFYTTKRPVKKPEDMKGLKIRVQQSELFMELVKSLGASPTPMSYDEVYSGLQIGVIDGAENNIPSYYSSHHYEVAKYFTVDKHTATPEVLIASKSLWDKLSDEDKKAFKEAAMESQKVQREEWEKLEKKSQSEIKKSGNKIIEIKNINEWRKAVQPVYDKFEKKYKKWIDEIQKIM